MSDFITRFAPSPTYYLHVGHGFSALKAYQAAKKAEGRFLLRIEDIDQTRCRPAYEQAIYEDMEWLGIEYEQPVRRQSDRLSHYQQALELLRDEGVIYRCFKTRREIAAQASPEKLGPEGPVYFGQALDAEQEQELIAQGIAFAWRLSIKRVMERYGTQLANLYFTEQNQGPAGEKGAIKIKPHLAGDVVLARKDIGISYLLASVIDDAEQNITHVIRGQDLFYITHIQVLVQFLLRLPRPLYHHHRLITDLAGEKLSKSNHALSLRRLREKGVSVEQMKRRFF